MRRADAQRERERERSTNWLRNRGVGREMLRLIQARGAPVLRIFRQLAELGVPCSMTEELTGCRLHDWDAATPKQDAALQTLWHLAETYTDVANRTPGALEGLDEVVVEAQALGVYYDPPACAYDLVFKRAEKARIRFGLGPVQNAKPGRTPKQRELIDVVWKALVGDGPRPLPVLHQHVVKLRLQAKSSADIALELSLTKDVVLRILHRPEVIEAIEKVKPLDVLSKELAASVRRKRVVNLLNNRHEGKRDVMPKTPRFNMALMLQRRAEGWTLDRIAQSLATTKQTVAYRLKVARRRQEQASPPL